MIRTFEEYTEELTEDEVKYILPKLQIILTLAIGKEKALTNKQIVSDLNSYNRPFPCDETQKHIKTSEPRIRKMIHILRVSDAIPFLIATSGGYYISNDKKEIETYIGSIDDRLRSIYQIRRALKRQMKEFGKKHDAIQKEVQFSTTNGELNFY